MRILINTYVILIRGINVGGRNKLLMKKLVVILEELGCHNVKTYIQSGNVVLQSTSREIAEFSQQISQGIMQLNNFEPHVLILKAKDFLGAIKNNPFSEAESEPKTLHFGFLNSIPGNPDLDKLESLKSPSERFQLIDQVFYLHAPDGIGRSKLAAQSEKAIGVSMTSRNWCTVGKISELIGDLEL